MYSYNPYAQNTSYSSYNMTPNINTYYNPLCGNCGGNGYFMNNNIQQPCNCAMSYTPNVQYTVQPTHEEIYYYPKHHRGLFHKIGDAFKAIVGCNTCRGSGWIVSKHGRHTYCPSCISVNKYCPKCDNTGIKWKNGKRCKHHHW
jgi:ribosomal protein L33